MKSKIFTFFVLVFGFCAFADSVSDCLQQKQTALNYVMASRSANEVTARTATSIIGNSNDQTIIGLAVGQLNSIGVVDDKLTDLTSAISAINCNSNDTCSVDLGPLVEVCSNIYDVVSSQEVILQDIGRDTALISAYLTRLNSAVNEVGNQSYVNVFDSSLLSAVSNFNNDVSFYSFQVTNRLDSLNSNLIAFRQFLNDWNIAFLDTFQTINNNLLFIYDFLESIDSYTTDIYTELHNIATRILSYLPYLKTISDDLKLIITNGSFQADYDFTNQLYASSLLGFDRFRYYAQGQSNNNQLQLYPLSPYDTASNLRKATIYDALSSGFASLLISQGSINNYLYWLKAIAGSNRLEAVEAHLVAVSNLVGRLDDYVLGDFSNEVSRLVESLSYVTNRVDYTTNLVEIASLLQTSTNHLASIDSKLDVLDYIKILSDTPLADYGGDIDYFDYLTNLYLNGASSAAPSTNWFERIEILLASLVFGDSDGTNGIPQSAEMHGFDSDTVEGAMNDFAFSEDFSTSIDNLSENSRNFMQVLNDYHSAIKNVSLPASVSIGLFGTDTGGDTTSYEQLLDHSFQVSFDVGSSDRFTVVVRAVTTMSWVLLTMIFIWHCGFWILQKIQFFYRLMRLLINSIWLKS